MDRAPDQEVYYTGLSVHMWRGGGELWMCEMDGIVKLIIEAGA